MAVNGGTDDGAYGISETVRLSPVFYPSYCYQLFGWFSLVGHDENWLRLSRARVPYFRSHPTYPHHELIKTAYAFQVRWSTEATLMVNFGTRRMDDGAYRFADSNNVDRRFFASFPVESRRCFSSRVIRIRHSDLPPPLSRYRSSSFRSTRSIHVVGHEFLARSVQRDTADEVGTRENREVRRPGFIPNIVRQKEWNQLVFAQLHGVPRGSHGQSRFVSRMESYHSGLFQF